MGKSGSRGTMWRTVDRTFGRGEKARGGRSNTFLTAQYVWTMIDSLPHAGVPAGASIRSANSLWYIRTASSKPFSRSRNVIFEEAE